jgi:ankyrin repeat protein
MTALSFGYPEAAKALVRRGALVDNLAAAAGLGMAEDFQRLLAAADAECRHRALALAAQHGHAGVVALLLGAGEDPNRYNPDGLHSHSTPLHQAILPGHEAVVRVLVENGAKLDLQDKIYQGTPLGWAMYAGRTEIANYLRAQGAK